jgi:hypothetical protein
MADGTITESNVTGTVSEQSVSGEVSSQEVSGNVQVTQLSGEVTQEEIIATLNGVIQMTTPAGNDKEIQYNNSGSFGSDSNFTWDYDTQLLTVDGSLLLGSTTQVNAILDEDDMISDSNTALATQQSIKAYVDDNDYWTRNGTVLSPKNTNDYLLMKGFVILDKLAAATGPGDYSLSWPLELKTSTWSGAATDESIYLQALPSDFFTKPEPGLGFAWSGVTRFVVSVDGMYYVPDLAVGDDSYYYGATETAVGKGCTVTFKAGDTSDGNNDGGDLILDAGVPAGTGTHGTVKILKEKDATAGDTATPSNTFRYIASYWDGAAAQEAEVTIRAEPISSFFATAAFYVNADNDDVFAIQKGDFIAVTPYDMGGGNFRVSYGCQYQSTAGVNAPIVNFVGGSCANGTPGSLRFIAGYDVASGTTAPYIFGSTDYGNQDLVFNFVGTVNSGQYSWMNDEDYFSFADAILLPAGTTALAPLRFTSGTLTTTPVAGAVEFLTDKFYATQTTGPTRKEIKLVDQYYAEMYEYENTTTTTIDTQNVYHAVNNFGVGLTNGFTFVSGIEGTIASISDYSGTVAGTVLATDVAHGLATGDIVTIHNSTNYNGTFEVTYVSDDTFYFTSAFTGDETANWAMGSYLRCSAGSDGVYRASFNNTSFMSNPNELMKFELNKNVDPLDNIACSNVYGSGGDYQSTSASGLVSLTEGDRIWLSCRNETSGADVTIRHANVNLTRL